MAKSNSKDRITVSFYEEMNMDMVLLQALNQTCPPRMRSNKIKEWAYEYIKNNPSLYEASIEILKSQPKSIEENIKPIEQHHKEDTKRKLKSKLNIITK